MSVSVGTLRIDLEANTASFVSEMGKASQLSAKTANDIKRSLEKISAVGIAMGAAIASGTVALIKGALDSADQLGKMAQSAGTTAETLSVLNYAAKLSGVQTDQLGVGLVRLSKAAFAAQGGNVQLERIFSRLGVTVTDSNGHLKDSGVLMQQLATKFANTADGAGKTAIATALFGKSGAALIPFLDKYGASQARVNAEAHRFGLVLGTSTVEVAAQAKENIGKLEEQLRGLGFTMLNASLPAIEKFSEKLLQVSDDANLPNLAKAFGDKLTKVANGLGNALDFAAQHAHGLKIALEALAALKVANVAIPIIGDLSQGKLENVGKGIELATKGLLGLGKTLPALAKFAAWAKESAQFTALLAREEGVATAATYVFEGALAALIAPAVLAGIGALAYDFYKISESIGEARKEGVRFSDVLHGLRPVNLIKLLSGDASGLGESIAESTVRHTPLDPRFLSKMGEPDPDWAPRPKNTFDTSGLGKPQRNPYDDEIRKLDQAIAAQKAYLSVLDGTPEQIEAVNAAEKARSIIVELNNRLIDAGKPKLTALQEATISLKVAQASSTQALVEYGRELVGQQHSADLATQQTRAMAAANLEGDAAIRRVAVDNAILGLSYNKTAVELRMMSPELAKLRKELTEKSNIDVVAGANKEIDGLRDQLAQRQILTAATLAGIDAMRQAQLQSKLYTLTQNIGDSTGEARAALIAKRDAVMSLAAAENQAADAESALSLLSPVDQLNRQTDALNHAVNALRQLQGGATSYGEELQIVAKMQENFNAATDKTIQLLLVEGSASDGVKAFFLGMQKEGQTTASMLYDSFNSAFNKLSEGITGVLTAANRWKRQEAINQFATMFDDLGKQLLNSTIKNGMQSGLGALGKAFGVNLGSLSKPDGSTSGKALWVRMASDSGAELSNFGQGSGIAGMLGLGKGPAGSSNNSGSANVFSSIGGKIASLFGGGKKSPAGQLSLMPDTTAMGLDDLIPELAMQSATPDMFANADADQVAGSTQITRPQDNSQGIGNFVTKMASTLLGALIPHADGGPISPSSAYLVGERGPEILMGASGRIVSNADSRRMLSSSSGDTHNHYIDARGSNDPAQVTAQIDRYMRTAGPKIAAASVFAAKDQAMRRPSTAPH